MYIDKNILYYIIIYTCVLHICIYVLHICIYVLHICIYVHIGIYLRFLKINAYDPHEVHASYGCSGPVAQAVARRDQ